jgi:hypothetical protein
MSELVKKSVNARWRDLSFACHQIQYCTVRSTTGDIGKNKVISLLVRKMLNFVEKKRRKQVLELMYFF